MDWLFQYTDPDLDWSYALVTLLVRFIGVFVVMLVMQVALQLVALAVRMIAARDAARERGPFVAAPAGRAADAPTPALDDGTVAAITVAMTLDSRREPVAVPRRPSAWAMAGRMRQMERSPARRG